MNPEVKAKWVAALRSGEYPQAQGSLQNSDGYCCLGVLCDISGIGQWVSVNNVTSYQAGDEKADDLPPSAVMKWAGIDADQCVEIKGRVQSLHAHNDEGATFDDLTKAIEEQL